MQLYSEAIVDQTGRTHLYRAADRANWYAMAAVQNAGLALDWVRRMLNASWGDLYASADAVAPGSAGLIFLPYLTRERPHHRKPGSSGAFLGMRIDHGREHLLHAALEGVAFGIRVALDALPGAEMANALRLAGGGSEHPTWRQMVADILKRDLVTVDTPAASARGAALLGGIASGTWADAAATSLIAPRTRTIAIPDSGRIPAYDEAYARYLSLSGANSTTA